MTRKLLKVTARLLLLAVILTAGGHTLLYVQRWQWARASLVGVAFVAALVIGATVLVMGRLDRLERRLVAAERGPAPSAVPAPTLAPPGPDTVGGEAVPDFRWLAPPAQTHVFIPVLLATGMIVSVIAAAVESVAVAVQRRRRTQPVLSRDRVRHPVLAYAAFLVGLAVATVLTSLGLYQVTHHWAGPQRAGTTELTVQVSVKDRALRTASMVEAAGRYCALNSGAGANYESVERESRDTALLHLTPSLDQAAQDRYVGCVEDTLLDRTQLEVTSVRSTPVRFVVDPR